MYSIYTHLQYHITDLHSHVYIHVHVYYVFYLYTCTLYMYIWPIWTLVTPACVCVRKQDYSPCGAWRTIQSPAVLHVLNSSLYCDYSCSLTHCTHTSTRLVVCLEESTCCAAHAELITNSLTSGAGSFC